MKLKLVIDKDNFFSSLPKKDKPAYPTYKKKKRVARKKTKRKKKK